MKRWTFRILICLVLGVVTTVGVAWGLAWWAASEFRETGYGFIDHGRVSWLVEFDNRPGI